MPRGRRNEVRNEAELALPSSSRQRPTASRRRRRLEGTSEPVSEPVDPSAIDPVDPSVLIDTSALPPFISESHVSPSHQEPSHEEQLPQDDISVGPLPGGPQDPSILKSFKNHVALAIWSGEERGILKCRSHGSKIPEWPLNNQRVRDIIMGSSLSPLIDCTYRFTNATIVSVFTERWQPETNTFHLPFGELSITLYDVSSILKIPVNGRSVSIPYHLSTNEARDLLSSLLEIPIDIAAQQIAENRGPFVKLDWLRKTFMHISDSVSNEEIQYASRAYLLFLLGCTLFVDKSGTLVSVTYLTLLDDLSMVSSYAWGAACLAYLYRQLGIASRREVKSISGYLTLLEAWVYEHFQFTRNKYNLLYSEEQPRALRWLPVRESDILQSLREQIDELSPDEVIWMPYWRARAHHPLPEITFFSGCLKCGGIIEPYHPERVLRQFGYVQTISPPPLSPIEARRGTGTASYRVIYAFIDDSWNRWDIHLLPPHRRGRTCQVPWEFTHDYFPWYTPITHQLIQNPARRSGFDRGREDLVNLAEARIRLSLYALNVNISSVEPVPPDAWRDTCFTVNRILSSSAGFNPSSGANTGGASTSRASQPHNQDQDEQD